MLIVNFENPKISLTQKANNISLSKGVVLIFKNTMMREMKNFQ